MNVAQNYGCAHCCDMKKRFVRVFLGHCRAVSPHDPTEFLWIIPDSRQFYFCLSFYPSHHSFLDNLAQSGQLTSIENVGFFALNSVLKIDKLRFKERLLLKGWRIRLRIVRE